MLPPTRHAEDRRNPMPPLPGSEPPPACRISRMGSGAVLLDAADGAFDDAVQRRVWAAARAVRGMEGVHEAVPGMNNLMVVFDALRVERAAVERALLAAWAEVRPEAVAGRTLEVPVVYGGEDLPELARRCGLDVAEVVRRHAAALYTVAAVGAMPGFPYLSGLDPALSWGRRASPRGRVPEGAVIIGGAQAGIMPCTAPSGWHVIGHTAVKLFAPEADDPVLLRPGDTVRFTAAGPPA